MKRRQTGLLGEKLAMEFLKKKGYHILEANYRCTGSELDIVAKFKGTLVFVEVRTKASLTFGSPEESITQAKMRKLRTAAARYRQDHENLPASWRIDVVAIEMSPDGKPSRIDLIENAVEGAE